MITINSLILIPSIVLAGYFFKNSNTSDFVGLYNSSGGSGILVIISFLLSPFPTKEYNSTFTILNPLGDKSNPICIHLPSNVTN